VKTQAEQDRQREIDGLRSVQRELRQSEARYRSIVESTLDAIVTIDHQNLIIEFNPAAEAIFGWRRDEVIGRDLGETLIPPALRAAHRRGLARHLYSTTAPRLGVRLELPALRRDGSEFPIEATITRMAGEPPSFTAFIRDLSERRRAESEAQRLADELAASEVQYRSLFVDNPQPMCVYDPGTLRIIAVNAACLAQYGYSEPEFLAMTMEDLRPAEDRAAWRREATDRPLVGPRRHQGRHQRKDGAILAVETFANDILFRGRRARVVLAFDVTEPRRAQQQLRESQRQLEALLGNLPGLAYRCSNAPGWPMQFASDGTLALTGYPPDAFTGGRLAFGELIHPDDKQAVWAGVQQAIAERRRFQLTYRIRCADGRIKWVWEQGSAVLDGAGSVVALEGLILDVTERRQAQEEIARLNAELEERVRQRTAQLQAANAELEAFSYSLAHDIRSPLTSIDGFSHVLGEYEDVLDERARHYLRRIRTGVQQMSELTDALLSLAQLSRVKLRSESVDLAQAARGVLAQLHEREPARVLHAEIPEHLWAHGDPRLLGQVMANLVGNAWKFSAQQPRTVVRVGSLRDVQGETVYFVADEGAGFDMAHASRLFGAFQRLHAPSEFEGTGIGLALVQKIIVRHGGRIWAQARPGAGATFYFTLGDSSEPRA
jgi:PAS domain S-box-containing protein